jgi:hypothetical protein
MPPQARFAGVFFFANRMDNRRPMFRSKFPGNR